MKNNGSILMILNWKLNSLLGFLVWGLWTLLVNFEAGVFSATASAITQGTISAISIVSLSIGMNYFLNLDLENNLIKRSMAILMPYIVLLCIIIISHVAINTHNIILTVLPSASIGILYASLYVYKSTKINRG